MRQFWSNAQDILIRASKSMIRKSGNRFSDKIMLH
jgi:hypothetical protein